MSANWGWHQPITPQVLRHSAWSVPARIAPQNAAAKARGMAKRHGEWQAESCDLTTMPADCAKPQESRRASQRNRQWCLHCHKRRPNRVDFGQSPPRRGPRPADVRQLPYRSHLRQSQRCHSCSDMSSPPCLMPSRGRFCTKIYKIGPGSVTCMLQTTPLYWQRSSPPDCRRKTDLPSPYQSIHPTAPRQRPSPSDLPECSTRPAAP